MKIHGTAKGGALSKKDFGVAFGGGGNGGFSPDDVDDLGAWYDASDSSTISESSGRVSQWNDKKGSANLVQATSGDQPLVVEAAQNDLDIIDFAGDRDMGTAGLSAIVQPQTWYVVATATSSDATRRPFWSGSQQFFTATTPEFRIYAGGQIGFNESLGTTQFYIWTLRFNGASSEMLLDDTSKVTGNAGTDSAGTLNVGGDSDKANNKFGEILRYDADVSSDDNDLIIDYLNDKWGL